MNSILKIILIIAIVAVAAIVIALVILYLRKKKEEQEWLNSKKASPNVTSEKPRDVPKVQNNIAALDAIYLEITGCEDETMIGKQFEFNKLPVTLGRSSDCDLKLSSREISVSRFHAQIIELEDGIYIQDTGSKYGTFVNNRNIIDEPVRIKDEDVIKLGTSVRIRYSDKAPGVKAAEEAETYVGFHLVNATLMADTERSKIRK